jgi:NAD+ diphosphatase
VREIDPGTAGLPFNSEVIRREFTALKPGDPFPDTPGYWVILQREAIVLMNDGRELSLPQGELPGYFAGEDKPLCIGLWRGRPLRVLTIGGNDEVPTSFTAVSFHWAETRLDDRLATLAGLAGQIIHWERRSRFCPCCAADLERIPGHWGKRCSSCRAEHYPHIHPCVIVLVKKGDNYLLVRKAEWESRRYSLIAGFLEFGESLEECVKREVREEAGVEVTNIRYLGSQNWPFPSQQMIGFLADYAGGEARGDGVEIADARWFSGDNMPNFPGSSRSIARWILDSFGLSLGAKQILS